MLVYNFKPIFFFYQNVSVSILADNVFFRLSFFFNRNKKLALRCYFFLWLRKFFFFFFQLGGAAVQLALCFVQLGLGICSLCLLLRHASVVLRLGVAQSCAGIINDLLIAQRCPLGQQGLQGGAQGGHSIGVCIAVEGPVGAI